MFLYYVYFYEEYDIWMILTYVYHNQTIQTPYFLLIFLNILSDLLENLGVAEPGLEGAMRADGNVSIEGGNKVEIKTVRTFDDWRWCS